MKDRFIVEECFNGNSTIWGVVDTEVVGYPETFNRFLCMCPTQADAVEFVELMNSEELLVGKTNYPYFPRDRVRDGGPNAG